jgi:hypothetical protein
LSELQTDYVRNADQILKKEKTLAEIIDKETVAKVRSMKIFDCLDSEKPTPMFLSLARASNSDKKLASICDSDGCDFETDSSHNEFIVKYFENVYKKDLAEQINFDSIIERFLGEDILTQTKKGLNLIHHF